MKMNNQLGVKRIDGKIQWNTYKLNGIGAFLILGIKMNEKESERKTKKVFFVVYFECSGSHTSGQWINNTTMHLI